MISIVFRYYTSEQALYRLLRLFFKKSERTHSAAPPFQAANAPLVCGLMRWGFGLVHLFHQHSPRRSKLCIACSDLFYKSERAHAAAPPFQIEPAALGFDLAKMDTLLFYFPQSSYCNLFRGVAECYAFSCFHDNVSLRDLPAIRHIKGTDAVIVNIDALVGNAILLFSVVHLDTVDQLPLLAERGIFRHLCRVSDHNFYKVIFVFAGKAGSRLTSYKTTCSKKSSRM